MYIKPVTNDDFSHSFCTLRKMLTQNCQLKYQRDARFMIIQTNVSGSEIPLSLSLVQENSEMNLGMNV